MRRMPFILLCLILIGSSPLIAQKSGYKIKGNIKCEDDDMTFGEVYLEGTEYKTRSDEKGDFVLENIPPGHYKVIAFAPGHKAKATEVHLRNHDIRVDFMLNAFFDVLQEVEISTEKEKSMGLSRMNSVEGFGIYEGKKTEVVEMKEVDANLATNSPRQVYAKIAGLNIWENDGVGLQLGIGGRGLSPNRTANFNVRQNGYDISADALGYPESYYTPPAEALERIEIIRGAASLQYGTQFGGMVNFKFKEAPKDKKIELYARQSVGSWGFFNTFNSLAGTLKNGKLSYYSYVLYKRGNGYRENSEFEYVNGYANLRYRPTSKLDIAFDFTKMNYRARQPGGMTDKNFEGDVRKSYRDRNWFAVDWNLTALTGTYRFSDRTQLNTRTFALWANRKALGNLERIHIADFGGNRTLIEGTFANIGNETRLLHHYTIGGQNQTVLTGIRLYRGQTTSRQGDANDGSGPDFTFLNPNNLENSDYTFPNTNYSVFAEHIFRFSPRFTITPGVRYEYINTRARGYYKQRVFNGAGTLIAEKLTEEDRSQARGFVIGGVGVGYRVSEHAELYANFSQNYKAINFSDLRVVNPNFVVAEDLKDETGYTADLGIRGSKDELFTYEITAFMLRYNDKIGQVLRADRPPLYNDYRYRGNISDALNIGLEFFGEINLLALRKSEKLADKRWTIYGNLSLVDARYINTEDNSIKNKKVEMVPPVILRTGTSVKIKSFRASLQHSYVQEHFSDATNAVRTATAVEGIIPTYMIMDFTTSYTWKERYTLESSVNNLLNEKYFTRRAEGYPGPGILPSDGRGFYLSLAVRL